MRHLTAHINYRLILISHGFGGWYAGHANTARELAAAGYLVVAPSHTGNHFADMSSPIERWAIDRPRHISAVLDYLLTEPETRDFIDQDKIGIYGFSAGGYTALSLIGGVPDLEEASRHAKSIHQNSFVQKEWVSGCRQLRTVNYLTKHGDTMLEFVPQ